jgi:hypothetical protein
VTGELTFTNNGKFENYNFDFYIPNSIDGLEYDREYVPTGKYDGFLNDPVVFEQGQLAHPARIDKNDVSYTMLYSSGQNNRQYDIQQASVIYDMGTTNMYLLISPALDLEDELIPIILEDNLQAEG